jgi:CBS domain-containing protein
MAVASGRVDPTPLVTHWFKLDDIEAAYELFGHQRDGVLKFASYRKETPMLARDIMTKNVVTVAPDTPVKEVARLLLEHGISAAPVVDAAGTAIGMISEGDLIGRNDADREARRDWWLTLLAEGEPLNPDFLKTLREPQRAARDVMTAPVITVTETTRAAEIARVLRDYRIKRVPVVRDSRVVGIVSRADVLRTIRVD